MTEVPLHREVKGAVRVASIVLNYFRASSRVAQKSKYKPASEQLLLLKHGARAANGVRVQILASGIPRS